MSQEKDPEKKDPLTFDFARLEEFVAERYGIDTHMQNACEFFGVAPEDVTPEMRRQMKIINFGKIYNSERN